MAEKHKTRNEATAKLDKARAKNAKRLEKIEKARSKYEKRVRKFHRYELALSELAQELYDPEAYRLGQAPADGEHLRPARLIINPKSGENGNHRYAPEEIVGALRAHGILAEVDFKTSGRTARELAKDAVDKGQELVIVAGGDGTIEEVAAQLINSSTTLGIIPTGTMNNLARALGIPSNLVNAACLIGAGATRKIDIGRIVTDQGTHISYFMETAGLGLGTIALPAGQAIEKGEFSTLTGAARKILDAESLDVEIELDHSEVIHANTLLVTVSNAPIMGKNLVIAPHAKMDDGWLDVAVYDGMGKTDLLKHFSAANNSFNAELLNLRYYRARKVSIKYYRKPDAHNDKDVIAGHEHLDIKVLPGAFNAIVGKGVGLALPVETIPTPLHLVEPLPEHSNGGANLVKRIHQLGEIRDWLAGPNNN